MTHYLMSSLKICQFKKSALVALFYLLFFAGSALAGAKLEVGLPGMPQGTEIANPAQYLKNIFIFSYSFIGFLAVAVIVYGGILYSVPGKTQKGKDYIVGALGGVVLLFSSYLILSIIDPALVQLEPGELKLITISTPEEYASSVDVFTVDTSGNPTDTAQLETGISYKASVFGVPIADDYIYTDLEAMKITDHLRDLYSSTEIPITITETTRNHGCSASDSCALGAVCDGTSSHCQGRAVDIRTVDKTESKIETILQNLSADDCVDELFYAGLSGYCLKDGQQARIGPGSACAEHKNHIHFSIKPECLYYR